MATSKKSSTKNIAKKQQPANKAKNNALTKIENRDTTKSTDITLKNNKSLLNDNLQNDSKVNKNVEINNKQYKSKVENNATENLQKRKKKNKILQKNTKKHIQNSINSVLNAKERADNNKNVKITKNTENDKNKTDNLTKSETTPSGSNAESSNKLQTKIDRTKFSKTNKERYKDAKKETEYETITEIKPIMHATQTSPSDTMYFDPKTGKPIYGPTPLYFDKATGKPVYSANQSGVKVVETSVPVSKKNNKASLSIASTVTAISGLLFFSICFFMISLSTSTSNGIFWGIIILTWLFGPIMMITIPPICYIVSIVLMTINFFKNPRSTYTWICIPINLIFLASGIYLIATYLPNIM